MANQIHLIGDFLADEAVADAALSPGHLIEKDSAGEVKKHATEGGYAERMVAVEDALQGKTTADAYSAGDRVFFHRYYPGAKCQMYLKVGENVAIGDKLISAGDGTLIANGSESSGTTVRQIIAIAEEALDLSGSGAVTTLMDVRIL